MSLPARARESAAVVASRRPALRRASVGVALAAVGACAVALAPASAPASAAAPSAHRVVDPAAATPDPSLATRASRAVTAALPTGEGTSAGTVRVTADAVTGQICVSSQGVTADPGVIGGLVLQAPDQTSVTVADGTLAGCPQLPTGEAADLLAEPSAYSLVLAGSDGSTLAEAPLAPAAAVGRPWAVGTRTETLVDKSRGTAQRGSVRAAKTRTIRVTYYFPAEHEGGTQPSLEGPFPVVLFEPGYAVTPATYERTLHAWASAGYLVAGILSPGSGGGLPGTPTEADLGAQPRDMAFVLNAIQAQDTEASSWLGGLADLSRVAVAGHSDGGSTAAAAGLLQAYTDKRYDAVLVMAGADWGGAVAKKHLPLLVISGQRDEYNSQSTFLHVWQLGRSTRTWVQALGARHLPPFTVAGKQADDLRTLEVAFFDRSLFGANTRALERSMASQKGLTRVAAGGF